MGESGGVKSSVETPVAPAIDRQLGDTPFTPISGDHPTFWRHLARGSRKRSQQLKNERPNSGQEILKVREDDLTGLENRFHGQLRNRHPLLQCKTSAEVAMGRLLGADSACWGKQFRPMVPSTCSADMSHPAAVSVSVEHLLKPCCLRLPGQKRRYGLFSPCISR